MTVASVAALETRGISVSFGGVRALHEVDIVVAPGEIVGIIGPNGAGKTTLFDAISGINDATGTVLLNGRDLSRSSVHARARAGLGRSFQDARLFHTMSVLDTLKASYERHVGSGAGIFSTLLGLGSSQRAEAASRDAAHEVVAEFGLEAYADKLIGELSTGTRRVVDLAGLVIARPQIILLDEPSSGIAQREAEALDPLLRRIREDLACALVIIEHDMPLLLGLAERMYALETGEVVAVGHPQEVIRDERVVQSYLGTDASALARSGVRTDTRTGPIRPRSRTSPKAPVQPRRAGQHQNSGPKAR